MLYLMHLRRDGFPVGVYTENAHYYDPTASPVFKKAGTGLVQGRDPQKISWADFCEQQASKNPGPNSMWDTAPHSAAPLADVLNDFQNSLE